MVELARAHAALVKDGSFQLGFPAPEAAVAKAPPRLPVPIGGGDGTILFGTVAGVAVLATLLVAGRVWRNRGSGGTRPRTAPAAAAAPGAAGAEAGESGEAEALAARGRHAEAVHALLLRAVARLRTQVPDLVRTAATSREIAASPALPAPVRNAFNRLAADTERGMFARGTVGEADWEACRTLAAAFGRRT